jgi:hypothetical protein
MDSMNYLKTPVLLIGLLALTACGGGGSSDPTPPANAAPSADAGMDLSVAEFDVVTLDGSSSTDPDNDPITYAWTQTAGTTVTIANDDMAQASFDAPDVTAVNTPETLTFQLQVSDGSLMNTATVTVTIDDVGLGTNTPPGANAGADQTVDELTTVNLDGSASLDADGDNFSYAWLQTAGTTVTLSDATAEQPSFASPDVTTPEVLTFQLTVDDGSASTMDTVDITVQDGLSMVTVAGVLSLEFPLPNTLPSICRGLNLDNPDVRPIRGVTVQLFDSSNALLGATVSGSDGSYSFSNIDASTDVYVRVRAELKSAGPAAWDVEVRDNVDTSLPLSDRPELSARPVYVVDFPQFNTGVANISDADFTATTGWGGSSYTGPRLAAPFAILDAIMDGMEMITAVDPSATFPPLDAFWSVNNTLTSPTDVDAGELSTSFYDGGIDSLFLLGDAATDTEEFDDHVTMHEWGHYFEDNFSRSDSIGGAHSIGQSLDPRLAFGEGFATALAAIALENPQYCDTSAPLESGGFGLDTEGGSFGPNKGFFNEMSVATLLYDLVDTVDVGSELGDGSDNDSIGFGPIYNVMIGPQATTSAFTSVFPFATELRNFVQSADLTFVDSQLTREHIDIVSLDHFGDGQTSEPAGARDVIPIYTDLPTDGSVVNVCSNSDFDTARDGNKLAEHIYLRMQVLANRTHTISVATESVDMGDPPSQPGGGFDCVAAFDADPDDPEVHTYSDPDFLVFRGSTFVGFSGSCTPNSEVATTVALQPGIHLIDLSEFRFEDDDTVAGYPERVCFDVTATQN